MTIFFYKCKINNNIVEGSVSAKDMEQATKQLEDKGLIVLELKAQLAQEKTLTLNSNIKILSLKEKKDFYNSFFRQYKAGISFFEVFNNIIRTSSTENIRSICFSVIKKLQKDNSFENAINYHSKYLGKVEAALLIAGEKSGKLEKILEKISQQIKEQEELKAELISKMRYPMTVLGMCIFASLVFAFFVFPAFNATLDSKTISYTQLLTSALIKLLISVLILGCVVVKIKTNKEIQKNFVDWVLKLKIFSETLASYYYSTFFMVLSLAQDSGVPIAEAINISSKTINLDSIKKRILKMHRMIEQGCEIATAFGSAGIFSDYAISQIATGEKSGELSKVYDDIAQDYKNICTNKIDALLKKVEPTMLIVLGIAILIIGVKFVTKYTDMLHSFL